MTWWQWTRHSASADRTVTLSWRGVPRLSFSLVSCQCSGSLWANRVSRTRMTRSSSGLQCVLVGVGRCCLLPGEDSRLQDRPVVFTDEVPRWIWSENFPPSLLDLPGFRSRLQVSSQVYFRFHKRLPQNPGGGARGREKEARVRMSHFGVHWK